MHDAGEAFREWTAFKAYRASHAPVSGNPWAAVIKDEVIGCFESKDAAIDRLCELNPALRECAVFHWNEEPAELSLCVVVGA